MYISFFLIEFVLLLHEMFLEFQSLSDWYNMYNKNNQKLYLLTSTIKGNKWLIGKNVPKITNTNYIINTNQSTNKYKKYNVMPNNTYIT